MLRPTRRVPGAPRPQAGTRLAALAIKVAVRRIPGVPAGFQPTCAPHSSGRA